MKKLVFILLICLTAVGASLEEAAALGENNEELVFTPLTPCRLIDTRNAVGPLAGNETRNYKLIGPTNYSAYGGNAAECGIPADFVYTDCSGPYCVFSHTNRVRALVLNVVAVSPQGNGHLRAWPTNHAMPGASILNYAKVTDETYPTNLLNVANGLVLRTCDASIGPIIIGPDDPCPDGDLSIYSSGNTHLLVDVLGYMSQATNTYPREGSKETSTALGDGACHWITSCSVENNTPVRKSLLVIATAKAQINHTVGTKDVIEATIDPGMNVCANGPSLNSGRFEVSASQQTESGLEGTIAISRQFIVSGNSSATYYLNAESANGADALDAILNATLQCVLLP
ncbi:MAG: hypothetical protein H6Q48_3023 [Deltaproteobacteria bacterium]|nr:hypothetical protein [Deltaproteobacteria bacterium]